MAALKQGSEVSGSRKRLSGTLERGKRGLTLTTDDGEFWVIDTDDDVVRLVGQRVVVEGAPTGLDRLKVDWVGEV